MSLQQVFLPVLQPLTLLSFVLLGSNVALLRGSTHFGTLLWNWADWGTRNWSIASQTCRQLTSSCIWVIVLDVALLIGTQRSIQGSLWGGLGLYLPVISSLSLLQRCRVGAFSHWNFLERLSALDNSISVVYRSLSTKSTIFHTHLVVLTMGWLLTAAETFVWAERNLAAQNLALVSAGTLQNFDTLILWQRSILCILCLLVALVGRQTLVAIENVIVQSSIVPLLSKGVHWHTIV